ncbi:MAG: hypothetical protein N2Z85_01220 [Patescibacteria group bacterium]|nr:hypothetical protein [Patescibacteria group bacterium]
MTKQELIKLIYLYLFSAIGLILIITGSVRLIDLGLKTFIFKQADVYYYSSPQVKPTDLAISDEEWQRQIEEQSKMEKLNRLAERQRTASNSIAMIIVGFPIFLYHWRILRKSNNN